MKIESIHPFFKFKVDLRPRESLNLGFDFLVSSSTAAHQAAAAKVDSCFSQVFLWILLHFAVAYYAVENRNDQDGCFFSRNLLKLTRPDFRVQISV
jgi:hypothetical protein